MANSQNIINPYSRVNPSSQLSGLQKLLDRWNLTNYEGKYKYQQDLLSSQWETENQLRQADLEYNSPLEQAKRQRQAGLNPDFNGVQAFEGVTSGNPASSGVLPGAPAEIEEPLTRIGQGLINGIQLALGIQSGIVGINSQRIANSSNAIKTASDAVKALKEMRSEGVESTDVTKILSSIKSRRVKRLARSWFESLSDKAFDEGSYKADTKYETARGENLALKSEPFYTSPDYELADQDMIDGIKSYNQLLLDVERMNADFQKRLMKSDNKTLDYKDLQTDYMMKEKPFQSDIQYNKAFQRFNTKVQQRLEKYFDDMMSKDNLWSQILLMSMFSSQTGSMNPITGSLDLLSGVTSAISPLGKFRKPVINKSVINLPN